MTLDGGSTMQVAGMKVRAPETATPSLDGSGAIETACCAPSPRKSFFRRPWGISGLLLAPIALYAGWDWLVATGLAAVLIGVAPCLGMCALGLCMRRGKAKGKMTLADIRKTYRSDSAGPT